jgi:hypothetical protein
VRSTRQEARQLERERRLAEPPPRPLPDVPPDQEADFKELMLAAEWTRDNPGAFVDTESAARILGVTPQYVARLAAAGRLPGLPTGRAGAPANTAVPQSADRGHRARVAFTAAATQTKPNRR